MPPDVSPVRLAALFWCYKDLEVSLNRLRLLRYYNPAAKIYALYGGEIKASPAFESAFRPLVDDYYCFPHLWDAKRKWEKGDLLIVNWFTTRGAHLDWDTIVIVQADMLVFGPIQRVFGPVRRGELLLSELRPIDDIENKWCWTSPENRLARRQYEEFIGLLAGSRPHESVQRLCCLFVVACLPKAFLEKYASWEHLGSGFLEYSIPCFAAARGFQVRRDQRHEVDWNFGDDTGQSRRPHLSATGSEPPATVILGHLLRPAGDRLFHPVNKAFTFDRIGRRWPAWLVFLVSWVRYKRSG